MRWSLFIWKKLKGKRREGVDNKEPVHRNLSFVLTNVHLQMQEKVGREAWMRDNAWIDWINLQSSSVSRYGQLI